MNDPHKTVIEEFLRGGWVYMLIGVAAMVARMLTISEKSSIVQQLKKLFVAAISSAIMWALIHDLALSDIIKASVYGVTGFIATEIIEGIVKIGKIFSKDPEKFIKKHK